jgi:hypothetical protein
MFYVYFHIMRIIMKAQQEREKNFFNRAKNGKVPINQSERNVAE